MSGECLHSCSSSPFINKITAASLNALKVHTQRSFFFFFFLWEIFALSPVSKVRKYFFLKYTAEY